MTDGLPAGTLAAIADGTVSVEAIIFRGASTVPFDGGPRIPVLALTVMGHIAGPQPVQVELILAASAAPSVADDLKFAADRCIRRVTGQAPATGPDPVEENIAVLTRAEAAELAELAATAARQARASVQYGYGHREAALRRQNADRLTAIATKLGAAV